MVGKEEPAEESKPVRLGSLAKPEPGVKRLGKLTKVGDLVKPVVKQEALPDGGLPAVGVTRGGVKKTKFEPKIPQRRAKKAPDATATDTTAAAEEEWTPQGSENPNLHQRRPGGTFQNNKGQAPAARVAFGAGAINSARSSGGDGRGGAGGSSKAGGPSRNAKARQEGMEIMMEEDRKKDKKPKHRPRLDLTSYYPVTLPTGPAPDSEAFERMDIDGEAEPGADEAQNEAILSPGDEDRVPAARELDLDTPGDEEKLLFFQLPAHLPVQSALGTKPSSSDDPSASNPDDGKGAGLAGLPEGYMGKLVVYKSGKVKLKLGDILLDAVPGAKCKFYQEVAAVDVGRKECHMLGSVQQRVVLTPDIDHLLSGIG